MKLFRRTRHVPSSLALLLLFVVVTWVVPPLPGQEQGAESDRQGQRATPPVSAATPQQTALGVPQTQRANAEAREPFDWRRDVEWSNWALLVAAIWAGRLALRTLKTQTTQIRLARSGVSATRKAADATRHAAETAALDIRLLHEPCIELVNPRARAWEPYDDDEDSTEIYLNITFDVLNGGSMPIQFREIHDQARCAGSNAWITTQGRHHTVGAGRSFPHTVELMELTADAAQSFKTDTGLIVDIQITFAIYSPIEEKEIYRTLQRRVLCRDYTDAVETIHFTDMAGWPEPPKNDDQ